MVPSRLRPVTVAVVAGAVVPLAVAWAWVPIRLLLPNVDLALVLLVVVAAVGATCPRPGVVVSAISSALWFEFFDTVPFERLDIARNPDVETTVVLAVVALMVGELAVRLRRSRHFARAGSRNMKSLGAAAELVASGEELVYVIERVVAELTGLLCLGACRFEAGPSEPGRGRITRSGEVAGGLRSGPRPYEVELPVVVQGDEIGRFVLERPRAGLLEPGALLVAVALSDTVGAAFLAQAPPPLPPGRGPVVALHVVGGGEVAASEVAAGRA